MTRIFNFTNWSASTRPPTTPHGAARLWNPSNFTPRTLAIPNVTLQHPDLNTERGTRPTTAGADPLLTLPEQRRSRQSVQDRSLLVDRSSGEYSGKTSARLPGGRRRGSQHYGEQETATGEAGPGPSTTAARVDAFKESMERKADSLMPEAASPQDPESGRTKSVAQSISRASIPMSRQGTGEPQGIPDEEEFSWGPSHPCYPHLNPHVPLDSPLYQSTRIIRIRRDWMQVGDLAPTFANLYPEILDHLIEESEFREIIKAINEELMTAFSPYSARAWIDTIMGVATFWLWDQLGLAGVKKRLDNVETRIEKWNRDVGIQEGVSIISLRRTAYLNLDIQIPDPHIGLEPSSIGSRPDTRDTKIGATEQASYPQLEQQTLPSRLAV
ncbi:Golgin subfamily A member 7/ERF4 family-domain-containing protein [Venturia nashicola]|nr:Golgin subfamily A member 7/ERF4 family-domain-containing protein [Venturia nashicola]